MARPSISTSSKSGNHFVHLSSGKTVIQNKNGKTYATKGCK